MENCNVVTLVGCVSQKEGTLEKPVRLPAKNLYKGTLFKAHMRYAKEINKSCDQDIYIISALYGLIPQDKLITTYDCTLNNMKKDDRKNWANQVFNEIQENIPKNKEIVILAGSKYYEFLLPLLEDAGYNVKLPEELKGLPIGKRLGKLKQLLGGTI